MINKYLVSDVKRLLKSYSFYISPVLVVFVLFFSLENMGFVNNSVIVTYFASTELTGMMLVYVFCAFPYAAVFCEDMEKQYIRYAVIRGNYKSYVIAKLIIIYISSLLVMVLGTMIFLLLCRLHCPWVDWDINSYEIQLAGSFGWLVESGHYFLYCILSSVYLGILAGTLSVAASFLSLYISNKMAVWLLPMLIYQILISLSNYTDITVLHFRIQNKIFEYDWQQLLLVLAMSGIPVICSAIGICRRIRYRW